MSDDSRYRKLTHMIEWGEPDLKDWVVIEFYDYPNNSAFDQALEYARNKCRDNDDTWYYVSAFFPVGTPMILAKFKTPIANAAPQNGRPPHPYRIMGYGGDFDGAFPTSYAEVAAYADDETQLLEHWPEAADVETEFADRYVFSGRFPEPVDMRTL